MIQERIMKNMQYFLGIDVVNDYMILKVKFPNTWGVFESKEPDINVTKEDGTQGNYSSYYYYGKVNEVTVDDLFDLFENTVEMNLNAEKKVEIFNKKFDELKDLFSKNNDIWSLEHLQFEFPQPPSESENGKKGKKTTKRKYTKKKDKQAQQPVVKNENTVQKPSELFFGGCPQFDTRKPVETEVTVLPLKPKTPVEKAKDDWKKKMMADKEAEEQEYLQEEQEQPRKTE